MSRFSVVIPTLNEERALYSQFKALSAINDQTEVIVSDGGSDDRTLELAASWGWRTVVSPAGRGTQMNKGAAIATGEVLVFLHADTILPATWRSILNDALSDRGVIGGNFQLTFAGTSWSSRFLTRLYPLLRAGGMCYGDSCFFVRRPIFQDMGGFRDYPIFEDCDLYKRLRRIGKFQTVSGQARTSSRRFEGRFVRTFLLWMLLQALYWIGVSPVRLGRMYRASRQ